MALPFQFNHQYICNTASKEKRKQSEEDSSDKDGQWSKPLDEEHAKKLHQGERQKDQDLLADFSMGKDAQYGNGQVSNIELYNSLEKDGSLRSDEKIGFDQNAVLDRNIRGIGSLISKTSQYGKNAMLAFNTGPEGTNGWQNSEGQVFTLNGADPADRFNRGSVLGFQDSILGTAKVNSNQHIVGYNAVSGVGFDIPRKMEGLCGKEVILGDSDQSGVRFDSNGSLCIKDGGLNGADMFYFKDNKLSEVGDGSRPYRDDCVTAEFDITGGDIGVAGKTYDKDDHLGEARCLNPELDGTKSGSGNNDMAYGIGNGGTISQIYVNVVVVAESEVVARFPSAGGIVVYSGIKGMSTESGTDRHNDAERLRRLYSKDDMIVDAGVCISGKKDVLKGPVRPDGGYYNMDVVLQGDRAASISSLYCEHCTLDGTVAGGPYTIRNINEQHGKEVEINGADARSISGLYDGKLGLNIKDGKLGRTEGPSEHCGKDGMLGEIDTNISGSADGINTLYGKGVLLDEIGANEYGNTVNIIAINNKNGIPNKASNCGADSPSGHDMLYGKGFGDAKDADRFYRKVAIQNKADTAGLSGQSIMSCGFYSDGGDGVREIDGYCVKGDILGKVGPSGFGIFDRNSMVIGTVDDKLSSGERLASKANVIGETTRMYDKNGMSNGFVKLGEVSGLYDKDGMLSGIGASGPIGAGSTAVFYSKNSMPNDTSTARLVSIEKENGFRIGDTLNGVCSGSKFNGKGDIPGIGRREVDSKGTDESYDKDGIPSRTCTIGYHGSVIHSLHDEDGIESLPLNAGTNKSGGIGNVDGNYGKDKMPNVVDICGLGSVGAVGGHNILCRGGPTGYVVIGRIYDKDSVFNRLGVGNIEGAGESLRTAGGKGTGFCERNDVSKKEILNKPDGASIVSGLYGKNGYLIGNGVAGGLDGLYGKNGEPGSRNISGIRGISGPYGKDGALSSTIADEVGFNNERNFHYHYNEDVIHCGDSIGVRDAKESLHEKKSEILVEEFLSYDQASGLYDAVSHAGDKRRQLSDLEASGSTPADLSRKGRREKLLEENLRGIYIFMNEFLYSFFKVRFNMPL